jgi:GMP synthase (glutamine-hydrolysing)
MFGGGPLSPALGDDVPVIEPVRELFKDEIRRIADHLDIPADLISRQPFPGSGLALRILGEVTQERLSTLRAADALFRGELTRSSAVKRLWQYFAVLSPMPGDEEKSIICLRAVHAGDRSQCYAARLPYDVMENVTDLILRDQKSVCRVTYDLTPVYNYSGVEWQ